MSFESFQRLGSNEKKEDRVRAGVSNSLVAVIWPLPSAAVPRCSFGVATARSHAAASYPAPAFSWVGPARASHCNRLGRPRRYRGTGQRARCPPGPTEYRGGSVRKHRGPAIGCAEMFEAMDGDWALRNQGFGPARRPIPGNMRGRIRTTARPEDLNNFLSLRAP
jgi:hypothetical protein